MTPAVARLGVSHTRSLRLAASLLKGTGDYAWSSVDLDRSALLPLIGRGCAGAAFKQAHGYRVNPPVGGTPEG